MTSDKDKQLFFALIYNFQMQTMMQLGKLANPMTGKSETELEGAQVTIDLIDMLKSKTKGNLEDDELRFLDQTLADLKLNFLEEQVKNEKELESAEQKSVEDEKSVDEIKSDEERKKDEEKKLVEDKKPVEEKKKPTEEKKKPAEDNKDKKS